MMTATAAPPRLIVIAALAANGVIGKDNTLPWRLPADLKRFKALTTGNPIVMGRKTWESLGRPLPGRHNIVVSRNPAYVAQGATVVASLDQAVTAAGAVAQIYVIGGAELYQQALARADRLELTEIAADFEGDARFPPFERRQWRETARERHSDDAGLTYDFVTYDKP